MKFIIFSVSCLLLLVPCHGQEQPQRLEKMIADFDAAIKEFGTQRMSQLPAARQLTEFTHRDLGENMGKSTLSFLRKVSYNETSWQIIARAVISFNFKREDHEKNLHLLGELYRATLRENNDWLNYSPPRGGIDPFVFRCRLAERIFYEKYGRTDSEDKDNLLLRDQPIEWINKYVPEVSDSEKPLENQASTMHSRSLPSSAMVGSGVTLSKTTPGFPRWAWWTGAGALVMGALAFLLKKRRNSGR